MTRYLTGANGLIAFVTMTFSLLLAGCGQPIKTPTTLAAESAKPSYERVGDAIRQDPVAYLESCLERCKKIDEFTTTFYRQERLGIVPTLRPVERIFAKWRRTPLSIKFDLPDDTSEYAQSLYIEGQNKNQLLVLPRHGLLGLPPTVGSFPISFSITFQKAKNPITDFGPQRMLERTLKKVALARQENIPGQIIRYEGIVKLELTGQAAHHIQIINPVHPEFPHCKQDLYIDVDLQIPAGSYVYVKENELDAMYLYANMKLHPNLTDKDFTIVPPSKTPAPRKAETASPPATQPES